MATPIIVPKEGQSMETCRIIQWLKKKGETVETGDILCEVETEKATFDLEAPVEGVLLEIFYTDDTEAPLLTPIAVIGNPGEEYENLRPVLEGEKSPGGDSSDNEKQGLEGERSVLKTEHTIKHHATVPSHQSEIVETEMYYEGLINERIRKIEQLNPHAEQISEILKDLSEFDNSLVNMKKDLEQAPGDERIIGAVMNTYRMKLEVLDNIVEIFQKKS